MKVVVSEHPVVKHKLAILRDKSTPPELFRSMLNGIATVVGIDAMADLPTQAVTVTTPMGNATVEQLTARIGLVPILRAGIGMVEPLLTLVPDAEVRHIGMFRNEETLQPVYYYDKLPAVATVDIALILDPMLATGGSAIATVDRLKEWGVKQIKFLGILAAPEGVKALHAAHPDVDIYLGALDSHLNDIGYIVPGLGDAGDRQFGT